MKWETTTEISHKKRTESQNDHNQNLKNRHRMDPMKKATNKYYIATKRKTMTINYKKKIET